jgi:hypothetical protein
MIEMIDSGHIDVYSHTFDMHQSAAHEETTPVRESIIPFEKESESDYINALNADIQKQHQLYEEMGLPAPNVLAFPRGYHQTISNVILAENNYDVTVTIDETRTNTLVCGLHQSLNNLGRFNIAEYTTDLQILDYLNK